MLQSISLKFTESDDLVIPAQGITVFVGPNNSGKSLVLKELERDFCSNAPIPLQLLKDWEIVWPDDSTIRQEIAALATQSPVKTAPERIYVWQMQSDQRYGAEIDRSPLFEFVAARSNKRWIASQYLRYFMLRLDGRTRFSLTDDRRKGDLLGPATNMLVHLFKENALRSRIRDIVHDAFGLYLTIDQLSPDNVRLRMSSVPPDEHEQHFDEEARHFHANAVHIKDASDGVQAFAGIICAALSTDHRALLIDEPEAFLHPPLARKLGYQLTSTLKSGASLLASTHSADFLMGCLQASNEVRVVRLEYSNGKSKGRLVDAQQLTQFLRALLMRSANVVSALFHDGVVVTESDNDRVFYSEIYHRLADVEKGHPAVLFINAQNKQTIRQIVSSLRGFGVPAVALPDLDILKNFGKDWIELLKSAGLPAPLVGGLAQQRGDILARFEKLGLNIYHGIDQLPDPDKAAASEFFDLLDKYGVFAVRVGELERWLRPLDVSGQGTEWTMGALEKMGSDPRTSGYLRPAKDDVWEFMRKVLAWIKEPGRKGMSVKL